MSRRGNTAEKQSKIKIVHVVRHMKSFSISPAKSYRRSGSQGALVM